jgi:hypothetical protein
MTTITFTMPAGEGELFVGRPIDPGSAFQVNGLGGTREGTVVSAEIIDGGRAMLLTIEIDGDDLFDVLAP